jgi:23S rRNA pseudouridine2604 synthase
MEEGIRINKFLSEAGVCSRREADRRIEAGEILIDGRVAVTGDKVMPGEHVFFQGREVTKEDEMILLAMNKPAGIVCTAEKREKNNVIDFLHYPKRVYPVGRLDKDSEGLLLLTNNGDIVNKMMRAGNHHEKEYIVTVNRPVSDSFLRGLAGGVPLVELGTTTRKCRVEKISGRQFRIILTQGLNRQIRRMCEYFGYRVEKLVRVRIMNIELGDLRPGEYRMVTGAEYQKLLALVRDSSNLPASQAKNESRKPKKRPTVQKERREKMENQMPQKARAGQETNKAQKRTDRKKSAGKRVYTVINGTEKN